MKHLHIFNPDNDLALASGLDYYTAPPMATKLSQDLQMLPAWWANQDDFILLNRPKENDHHWAEYLNRTFGIKVSLIDKNHLQNHQFSYQPWGWNMSLRNQLLKYCVEACQLPSADDITVWRKLSHRRLTIEFHRQIARLLGYRPCPEPQEITDFHELERFSIEHPRCFLKAPWSSSGKGIFRPTGSDNLTFSYWANGILQRQGSVIAEQALAKTIDFAMEFRCENSKTEFIGYSIYQNNRHNAFDYGLVANEHILHKKICDEIGGDGAILLRNIQQSVQTVINDLIAPHYNGFLGIDMLVFVDEFGEKRINPCVEINLRCTMGVVTSIVGNRFLHPQSIGKYHVEYHKAPLDVNDYVATLIKNRPPEIELIDGLPKIKSGTILMAPVYPDSRYCVYIDAQSI